MQTSVFPFTTAVIFAVPAFSAFTLYRRGPILTRDATLALEVVHFGADMVPVTFSSTVFPTFREAVVWEIFGTFFTVTVQV